MKVPKKLPWFPQQPIRYDPKAAVQIVQPAIFPQTLKKEPPQCEYDRRERYSIEAIGPKGSMRLDLPPCVRVVEPERGCLECIVEYPNVRRMRCHWGTTRARVANMIHGVTVGWVTRLRFVGVGYRVSLDANTSEPGVPCGVSVGQLVLRVGFIRPVVIDVPPNIGVVLPAPDVLNLHGPDLHALTTLAARIRALRKPEAYNLKGIFVNDETIVRKKVRKNK